MAVHNHGPEEGPGLACNEMRLPDDSFIGACWIPVDDPEDENPNIIRGED